MGSYFKVFVDQDVLIFDISMDDSAQVKFMNGFNDLRHNVPSK